MTVTTPDTTKPEAAPAPSDVTPVVILDESQIAPCRCCGVGVHLTPQTPNESREFRSTHPVSGVPMARGAWTQNFAQCAACTDQQAVATAILEAHPAVVRRLGPGLAMPRMEAALVALNALGQAMPDPAALKPADVARLLRFMATVGAGMEWTARADVALGHALPFPYAHLEEKDRVALRGAYADLLADRLAESAPPARLAPPPLASHYLSPGVRPIADGCLLCGLGAVTLDGQAVSRMGGTQAAADEVWTLHPACSPQAVGGKRSAGKVRGYTCPACSKAVDRTGVLGPSAMEWALATTLGIESLWHTPQILTGLVGWGGLAADALRRDVPPPQTNAEPWAHLGDLDALKARLDGGA